MALVREWIDGFLTRHRARYGPHDWPMRGTEEYAEFSCLWITSFAAGEVSESEADAASFRMGADPPRWRNEHIPRVIAQVKAIREERGAPAATREDAEARSRGCEYCGGTGLACVYSRHPDPESRVPVSVGSHCICDHGRWIRRQIDKDENNKHLLKRIPDLAMVLDGRSSWMVDPPWLDPALSPGRRV